MTRRNLGRRMEPVHPLRPRCPECRHVIPAAETAHLNLSHWPKCSQAEPWQKALWEQGDKLRKLRTIERIDSPRGLS